ncbi:MAG: hypothetical protein ABUL60_32935 [Myxococcales bacterium]
MPNMVVTHFDQGTVQVSGCEFRDEFVAFAGAATYPEGTLLARRADALAVTASAVSGGGNGTVSLATVVEGPVVPLVGVYTLTCLLAITNGGKWKLTDPNGAIVADDLEQTVGAGAATVFEVGGLQFTITDGGTDFSAGATATLTVAADGKMVAFAPGGAGGAQIPMMVLARPLVATGAGNLPTRPIIKGKVAKERLSIFGGGTITDAMLDQLRGFGIIAESVTQLGRLDN